MATNPFYIAPADYSEGFAALGQGLGALGQKFKADEAEAKQAKQSEDLKAAVDTGDLDKVADFMLANPEMSNNVQRNIFGAMGIKDDIQKNQMKKDTFEILNNPQGVEQTLTNRIQAINDRGGDPSHSMQELESFKQDPKRFLQSVEGVAATSFMPEYKSWSAAMKGGEPEQGKPFQMGTGQMAGYTFDPNKGEYSIDPKIKEQLTNKATEKAALGVKLGAKDRQSINKDVTGLIKDTVAVSKAASSLQGLKKSSSAAAKLAAVFAFMKSLDPTSVVRESEQGQVYSAQGAASSLAGMLNNLVGEGKLTDAGFDDLVNTSNNLANSAIEASGGEVNKYLDTYENTIPDKFKSSLVNRVPKIHGGTKKPDGKKSQVKSYTSTGGTQFTVEE